MNKRIVICTGGTGGHVIPSVNFGNFLIDKGYDCHLILDNRGKKYSQKFKGSVYTISSSHFSGNFFFKLKALFFLVRGFIHSLKLIYKIKPNKCISFGSYATFAPMLSVVFFKYFFKINIFVHEQNSRIGKVNLFFLPFSKYIFTNFEKLLEINKKYISKKIHVGLPSDTDYKFAKLNKKNNQRSNIFVYGGSQGSIPLINKLVLLLKKIDSNNLDKFKFIIQCPKNISEDLNKSFIKMKLNYEINEFYQDMDKILNDTYLALVRAGSGTINDIIKYKIPSIIIPLPHSINNHQYYNAKYLFDKKGAILMEENNLNINSDVNIFLKLINDKIFYRNLQKEIKKINLPNANEIMLTKIYYEKK